MGQPPVKGPPDPSQTPSPTPTPQPSQPNVPTPTAETCDSEDNDLDGAVDEGAADAQVFCRDLDGDDSGAGEPLLACLPPQGYAPCGDCDDADPATDLGAPEICDGQDNNCDGEVEVNDPSGAVPETS